MMNLYKIDSKYTNILDDLYDIKDSFEYKEYKEALLQYLEFDNTIDYIMSIELDMSIDDFDGFRYNNPEYREYTNDQLLKLPEKYESIQLAMANTRLTGNIPDDIEQMYLGLASKDYNGLFNTTWRSLSVNKNLSRDQIEILYDCYVKHTPILLVEFPFLMNLTFEEIEHQFYESVFNNKFILDDNLS